MPVPLQKFILLTALRGKGKKGVEEDTVLPLRDFHTTSRGWEDRHPPRHLFVYMFRRLKAWCTRRARGQLTL
jgi:hypothetical protein